MAVVRKKMLREMSRFLGDAAIRSECVLLLDQGRGADPDRGQT
jgi:hypothetical protein